MNIQIRKLIIWPRKTDYPPREVSFELNKVNVITGGSRTGKSAIIPIIDYCLASRSCSIPIDTIRDHAAWYGVVIQIGDEQALIARRVPKGNKPSTDFYYERSMRATIPVTIETRNTSFETVKQSLNEIALLPYFSIDENEENPSGFKSRLSFRDLMAFVFQTQDIVANQNILFYKTHAHEHREKLRTWFPFILGAISIDVLKARQRLSVLERKLFHLQREYEKEKSVSEQWKANIFGHLRSAVDYGILEGGFSEGDDPETLLQIGKELIDSNPDKPTVSTETVNESNRQIFEAEQEDNRFAGQIARIRQRLDEVKKLKDGFSGYGEVLRKRTNRLHISKWLSDISQDVELCPICGHTEHPNAFAEISKISKVLEGYEAEANKFQEIPTTFDREEERLKQDLEDVLEDWKANRERYDWLVSQNETAKKEFYTNKEMYKFLGHFKASLERFEKIIEGGELENQIAALQEEYDKLKPLVNEKNIQKRIYTATETISQTMLTYLKELDVEDKYRQRRPEINIKELAIRVMGNEGDWHFLSEVGSASNWVSFHIAAMCAFQEFFASLSHSSVPSFVIFDQPSQVYFPKVSRQESNDDRKDFREEYKDEDLDAVKKIFSALSKSISQEKVTWQFIVLDHADSDVYGDVENVHEVEIWRDGKKLIPEYWYVQPL